MKKMCFSLALFIGWMMLLKQALFAQEVDTTYAARMNYIFKFLDKSKIPTGILKDAALEFAELNYYNGASLQDSSIIIPENFRDIYLTLATGQLADLGPDVLPHPDLLDSIWFAKRKPGQVTLAGLYYQYSRFSDDAPNKVTILNDQIYDQYVNGEWQNPYTTEQAVAFSPANLEYTGLSFALMLPSQLWLSNNKQQVSKIEVDMDDGLGYRQLNPGMRLAVSYADSGLKALKFKVWLNNNTILQSHSALHIKRTAFEYDPALAQQSPSPLIGPDQAFIPPDAFLPQPASALMPAGWIPILESPFRDEFKLSSTETLNGKKAEGLITIVYAKAGKKITKPLIVAEGFDPDTYSFPEKIKGQLTYDNLIFDINSSYSPELQTLLSDYSHQYDIIYIDWKDGTADMRLNALLLKTVIRDINQVKVADGANPLEKNVVLGQSMGGVITRYALKKMELAGENHDVRLYISHDAPHQGANVPLGIQAMAVHLRRIRAKFIDPFHDPYNIIKGFRNPLYVTETMGAKQLLSNRLNDNIQIDNGVFNNFQTELKNLGYPQQCRNIAISNGSECGTPYPIIPGDHLIKLDGYYKTKFLADIFLTIFPIKIIYQSGYSEDDLMDKLPGSHRLNFNIEINTINNGGGNTLYKCKVAYKKKILWIIPVSVVLASGQFTAPNGLGPVDCYPGGTFSLTKYVDESALPFSDDNNVFYFSTYKFEMKSGFSFIPTTSALDIGKGQVVLSQSDYYQPYVGALPPPAPKNSPFDNFITAFSGGLGTNEGHISFTQRNGAWLAKELSVQSALSNCIYFCQLNADAIQGPSCFDSNQVYNISSLLAGSTISWSVFGPASISGANNQNTVNLISNGMGTATLTAHITNNECGSKIISIPINVGILTPQIILSSYSQGNVPVYFKFKVTNPAPNLIYKWYVNGVLKYTSLPGEDLFQYTGTCSLTYEIKCTASSNCLTSAFSNILSKNIWCLSAYPIVYPNPVADELSVFYPVDKSQQSELLELNPIDFEVRLYNEKSVLVLSQQSHEGERNLSLDTRNLTNGIYFLHIQQGKQLIKQQIIIQH